MDNGFASVISLNLCDCLEARLKKRERAYCFLRSVCTLAESSDWHFCKWIVFKYKFSISSIDNPVNPLINNLITSIPRTTLLVVTR